jgi:hypothetical protein
MRRLTAFLRVLVALATLAQPVLPGGAAVVDGLLARRAGIAQATAHVEDARQPYCPFVHDAECGIGHDAAVAALPHAPRAPFAPAPASRALGGTTVDAVAAAPHVLPPGRGPPRA